MRFIVDINTDAPITMQLFDLITDEYPNELVSVACIAEDSTGQFYDDEEFAFDKLREYNKELDLILSERFHDRNEEHDERQIS